MNLKCLICSDLFTPSADIHTTPCGHLFHYLCLSQWLERSRTCPQCRCKATDKNIHKIYLSVEENAEVTDLSTLQNKLDNLQFEIGLKENHIKKANEKCSVMKAQNVGLREEVKELENKARVLESAMHALKEQVTFFKTRSKDKERLQGEINSLKNKLTEMQYLNVAVNGNQEDVNDVLRNNLDPQFLSVLVSTLKKELTNLDKAKNEIQAMFKEAQNQSLSLKTELTQLNRHNNKLQQELKTHKHCESEKKYLKRKINELCAQHTEDTSIDLNDSIQRIVTESPAPLPKIMKIRDEDKETVSPSVPEKVQAIKDSDSPYLQVQSSSEGLSGVINYNAKFLSKPSSNKSVINNNKFSIFKHPSFKLDTAKAPSSQVSYNGLGGHSKDEEFPTSQPNKAGMKRSKSTSAVTSAKFRKLGPAPQKKLNDFFETSQCN